MTVISISYLMMLIICFVRPGFGGAFWLMWIGGMPLVVLRVLLRMALVRVLDFVVILISCDLMKNNNYFLLKMVMMYFLPICILNENIYYDV